MLELNLIIENHVFPLVKRPLLQITGFGYKVRLFNRITKIANIGKTLVQRPTGWIYFPQNPVSQCCLVQLY